eukprot:466901_1
MSVEVFEQGKYIWPIMEALDESKLNPARFGRYVARFKMDKQQNTPLKFHVVIWMKFESHKIPALLNMDKRTLQMLFKLSRGAAIGWKSYKVTDFKKYQKIFDKNITKAEMIEKKMAFVMTWKMNVGTGFDKQEIEYDTELWNYREMLYKNVLVNGDIKIFYEIKNDENTNNSNNKISPKKKRKLNNGKNKNIGLDEERNNYVMMSKWLLEAQSDYFKTYLNQQKFKDAGYIQFCGYKLELLAFIRFIVTGVIPVNVHPLRLCVIAGIYGVKRLQHALVPQIVAGLTVDNFVPTMNTLIKTDTIDNVYSEIVNFGVQKYRRLKGRSDWNKLNVVVRNTIKMMYQDRK